MKGLAKIFTCLAALAFVLAVVATWTSAIMGIEGEGFSRACTNLAVLAIAMIMSFGDKSTAGH